MKMIIKRTSFWITEYRKGDCKSLEGSLSVWDNISRRYIQHLYHYDAANQILKLPKGLGQEFVLDKIAAEGRFISEVIDESDVYSEPRYVEFDIHPEYRIKDESEEDYTVRDKFQKGTVSFIVANDNEPQKMVSLDTGFGKTFCMIIASQQLHVPTMVICRTLGKQWIDFIIDRHKGYTNLTKFEVIQIVGSDSIKKLLKIERPKQEGVFYVASTDTLLSYLKNGGDLQELSDHLGIGTKAFDEAHLNYVANVIIDCNMQVKNTIYMTATPGRSESRQNFLFKRIYRFVPMYGEETHILKQYYNIRLVNYNTWPTADQVGACSTRRGFNSKLYAEYIFTSQPRKVFYYGMIRSLVKKIREQDDTSRILIILDRKTDIQEIHDILSKDLDITVGRYCTLIDKLEERELELRKDVVLSTVGSGVTGKDIPSLRVVMAMTSFSSNIIVRQLLGRLRSLEGKRVYYLDFVDAGFPQMIGQRRQREFELKIRSSSWETIEFEFDDVIEELQNSL
jgi:superfamily II DNA or RNA helicase